MLELKGFIVHRSAIVDQIQTVSNCKQMVFSRENLSFSRGASESANEFILSFREQSQNIS